MAKNPFNPKDVPDFNLPRNSFDLSNNELFSAQFGQILPVSCTEVIPGDTFKCNSSSVGVRAMPTAFPIQTPIKGRLSWFYVRNRTLWKDFEDFIFKTKPNLVAPWLRYGVAKSHLFKTGSLADCLGLATTRGEFGRVDLTLNSNKYIFDNYSSGNGIYLCGGSLVTPVISLANFLALTNGDPVGSAQTMRQNYFAVPSSATPNDHFYSWFSEFLTKNELPSKINVLPPTSGLQDPQPLSNFFVGVFERPQGSFAPYAEKMPWMGNSVTASASAVLLADGSVQVTIPDSVSSFAMTLDQYSIGVFRLMDSSLTFSVTLQVGANPWNVVSLQSISNSINDFDPLLESPFVSKGSPSVPQVYVNALPFRAYEMICNYYFRNDLNNPYILNGQVEYNKFIPTDEGGADENEYTFHFHNLELDQFTSAVQSPQFGEAPLVGLEYNVNYPYDMVRLEFQDDDSNTYTAEVAVDPNTSQLFKIANASPDMPSGNLRTLMDMVDSGFSINTLRNVNSFQRFLENTIRRGLRYRNQLKSHHGVDVDYPDIDVPQYLGGVSAYLNSGQINNMSETGSVGLGDYVGTLNGVITMERNFQCFCPEHGFIIGVFSISPTPIYPQSTAKYLLKHDPFDYFNPEFSKIGYVPIFYSEVAPGETRDGDEQQDPNKAIFGYQRAWYEYMQKYDNIHGDFRNTLLDFTLARQFYGRPLLGRQFTQVNPEDYDHVFLNRNIASEYGSNAKFLLSVSCNIDVLRQIPRHGVPSLE